MDEFESEQIEDENSVWLISRRVTPADIGVLALGFAREIAGAFENAFGLAQHLMCGHANYLAGQRHFHQQAAREIETLTSGDEDG